MTFFSSRTAAMRWALPFGCTLLALVFALSAPAAAQDAQYLQLMKAGKYEEARQAIERHREENRGRVPANWIVDRAELHFITGQVEEAIAILEKEMAEYYPEPTEIVALAHYYQYTGRTEDFDRLMEKARRVVGIRWPAYLERVAVGRLLLLLDQQPKTILSAVYDELMDNLSDRPEAFIAAGDLAYSKKGYDVASGYYQDALEIEPDNQDAMCGLAEVYWRAYDPRLEEIVSQFVEVNPNHPRIRAIQAEKLLESGKFNEGLDLIEKALEMNPNATRFMALKAAAHFLLDEPEEMKAVQELALAFNPKCSDVYRIPGRIASRHYRFREGVEFHAKALEINPEDRAARAYYAFDLLRIGREDEGIEQLERAFDEDPYDVQVYNMLTLMDSMDRFKVIERGDFKLQVPADEADILAEEAFALLEEAAERYQDEYKMELETPVLIQLFDDHDDFMVRALGLPGNAGHLGICFGQLVTMDSPSAREPGTMNWHSVLWHEFVHVITLQKTKNRMPRWLSEGISVYEETRRSGAWGQDMMADFKPIVETEELPGLRDIEAYFTQPKSTGHLMFGYFVAGEFIQHYVDEYSHDALVDCLDRIANKELAHEALAGAAGVPQEELDGSFKAFLAERLKPYDNLPKVAEVKTEDDNMLDRLLGDRNPFGEGGGDDAPFRDAMQNGARAVERENWDDAIKHLEEAYRLFPDYKGEDAPLFQLVHVYSQTGDGDKLIETLERIIAEHSSPFTAMSRLAATYENRKRWEDVRRVAELAMGINPFDVDMRKKLLAAQRELGEKEDALITLAQLAQLDKGRDIDYLLERAGVLADLGQLDEARTETLRVLERTPHFWEAQQQLLRIVEADQPEPPPEPAS
jgi:tetratricopeptide (TPR) repeat protein